MRIVKHYGTSTTSVFLLLFLDPRSARFALRSPRFLFLLPPPKIKLQRPSTSELSSLVCAFHDGDVDDVSSTFCPSPLSLPTRCAQHPLASTENEVERMLIIEWRYLFCDLWGLLSFRSTVSRHLSPLYCVIKQYIYLSNSLC